MDISSSFGATFTAHTRAMAASASIWEWLTVAGIVLGAGFVGLGDAGFWGRDEGRYAEIAREMVASGDWVTPRLVYVPYFEKPPLLYWLTALSFKAFGPSSFAGRLPSVLAMLATVAALAFLVTRVAGGAAARTAAIALATSLLAFVMGRTLTTDMLLTGCYAVAMVALFFAFEEEPPRSGRWFVAFAVASGLAVLAKGIVGLVLPLATGLVYAVLRHRVPRLSGRAAAVATGAWLVVVLPWFVMVSVHNRGFLHFFFVVQHLERFLGGTAEHAKPWWYFLPITLAGLLPWTFGLFVRPAARTDAQTARLRAFLWTWAVVIVCFFSASSCKLVAYVLPALPALAGVLGLNLAVANERSERRGCSVAGWASVAFFAVLAVVWPVWAHHQGDFALGRVGPLAWRLTVASVVAALAFGWWSARRLSARWLLLPAAGTALVWLALNGAATNLSPELGHEDVCLEAVRQMGPRDVFVLFRHYDPGMVFYVRRRPIIFDVKNELAFGMAQEPMGDWYREGDRAFIDLMRGPRRVFCFSGQEQYEAAKKLVSPLYVISRARKRVVFSNRPPGPSRPAGGGT